MSALNASLPSLARDDRDQRREGEAVRDLFFFLPRNTYKMMYYCSKWKS